MGRVIFLIISYFAIVIIGGYLLVLTKRFSESPYMASVVDKKEKENNRFYKMRTLSGEEKLYDSETKQFVREINYHGFKLYKGEKDFKTLYYEGDEINKESREVAKKLGRKYYWTEELDASAIYSTYKYPMGRLVKDFYFNCFTVRDTETNELYAVNCTPIRQKYSLTPFYICKKGNDGNSNLIEINTTHYHNKEKDIHINWKHDMDETTKDKISKEIYSHLDELFEFEDIYVNPKYLEHYKISNHSKKDKKDLMDFSKSFRSSIRDAFEESSYSKLNIQKIINPEEVLNGTYKEAK